MEQVKYITAMQELKEKLLDVVLMIEEDFKYDNPNHYTIAYKDALVSVVADIDAQMLQKERGQIEWAFSAGFYTGCDQPLLEKCISDYITQTYK